MKKMKMNCNRNTALEQSVAKLMVGGGVLKPCFTGLFTHGITIKFASKS